MSFLEQFNRFHQLAAEATGLDDFGSDSYREPLRLYLADLDKYGNFSEAGKAGVTGSLVGLLSGRLLTCQGIKSNPLSQEQPIARPIFIVGLTRSGTTVLHRLISHDPHIQFLPFWLANAPMPKPPRDTWESHPVYRQIKKGFEEFIETIPGFMTIHPIYADKADECRYLMDQTCYSNTFCTTTHVPEYQEWLIDSDMTEAFGYYRQALALIADGDNRRWVLKDPAHLFCLDSILDTFPDACIVHTHRDPFDAMASTTHFTHLIRKAREPSLTMAEVGKDVVNLWGQGLRKMEQARQRHDASRILDLHMLEIRREPLSALERIYDYFDLPIPDETRNAWEHQLKTDPNQAHGTYQFDINDIGFTRDQVVSAVGSYHDRYNAVEAKGCM